MACGGGGNRGDFMADWKEMYRQKLVAAEDAVDTLKDGDRVCVPLANGQPVALVNAMTKRMENGDLNGVDFISALDARFLDMYRPEVMQRISRNNIMEIMYCGPISRHYVRQGLCTYTAHRMFEGPRIAAIRELTVAMITVSPMDRHGFFSMGTNPDYMWGMIRHCMPNIRIIAEVNQYMPSTYGNNHFHISEIDLLVEHDEPLVQLPDIPITQEDEAIASMIAEMVPDGACLQIGIGGIPNAVAQHLVNKRDLGIHSEMLCDSMVDLYEVGAITCRRKQHMPLKWVAAFAVGTNKLYDFMNENPMIEMHNSEMVNDPYIIGLNDNVISINSTLEVDLTGQCASEAIGTLQYSGAGGQMDFIEGAWRSKGGKAFLATYSTYRDNKGELHSKIVPMLPAGAQVTTPRGDVQYVVTEYGVAYLKGQHLRKRVEELISVAHPDFRDWLRWEARKLNYIP